MLLCQQSEGELHARADLLGEFLQVNGEFWRELPYQSPQPEWLLQHPELARACLDLDSDSLAAMEREPEALLTWLPIPGLAELARAIEPPLAGSREVRLAPRWEVGIPGRKQAQIEAFISALSVRAPHIIDWCCGKGFLSRTLLQCSSAQPMPTSGSGYEINPELCRAARQACQRAGVDLQFHQVDVLRDCVQLPPGGHALALHACGDLHRQLVRQAVADDLPALSIAPCCYALWLEQGVYQPLSAYVQQRDLHLNKHHLKLAVQETVTSSPREQAQLHQLNGWRLGFDELQRQLTGRDTYMATPSLPKSAVSWGFQRVCEFLAGAKALALPADCDWASFELAGHKRWQTTRRLQLVSQGFRRLLELWLIYDMVLFLAQSGYQVQVERFCQRQLTPRNILLSAQRIRGAR